MLKGWEEFYEKVKAEIDDTDLPVVKLIAKSLNKRVGKENAITNKQMRKALKDNAEITIHPIKMRKIIQYIRVFNLVPMLCASSKGYWRAETEQEFIDWSESAESRASMQLFTVKCQRSHSQQEEMI